MHTSPAAIDFTRPAESYERWLVDPLFRPFALFLIEQVGLVRGDRVLDVACGTGVVARLAAMRTGDKRRVVGVDSSRAMLTVARQIEPAIDWREGSASDLPLAHNDLFNVVLCAHGLQFFPDRAIALRQMHAALHRGGRIGISTWSPIEADGLLHDLQMIAERRLGPVIDRRHAFGDERLMRQGLENAGFQDVEVTTVTRRVTFPDPGVFLQLNSRALLGMSPRTAALSESDKALLVLELVEDSVEAARMHITDDGLTFTIGSVLATARR